MRHAMDVQDQGPLRVTLHDGTVVELAFIDGGGQAYGGFREHQEAIGGTGGYEVHGNYLDGDFACITQDQIAKVEVIATGEEVEFGNPYMPGHPRPQDLEDES